MAFIWYSAEKPLLQLYLQWFFPFCRKIGFIFGLMLWWNGWNYLVFLFDKMVSFSRTSDTFYDLYEDIQKLLNFSFFFVHCSAWLKLHVWQIGNLNKFTVWSPISSKHWYLLLLKCFLGKSGSDSWDFYPDPPYNEQLKSSVFWMN